MNPLVTFILIVVLGLIPGGTLLVWSLYKKSIVFQAAMLVFISSMVCAVVAFAVSQYGFTSLYWAIPSCLAYLLSTNLVIKKVIRKPLIDLRENIDKVSKGILDVNLNKKTLAIENEMGSIARSFETLVDNLHRSAAFADEIAQANFTVEYNLLSDNDKLGKSLLNMRQSLVAAQEQEKLRKKEDEKNQWITEGVAKFSEILRNESTKIKQLSNLFIQNLVDYMGAVQGGLFILNNENPEDIFYELTGAVAYDRIKMLKKEFRVGESLVGRCIYEKKTIYMTEVPDRYVTITSGLGTANPKCILLAPAIFNDIVFGVIELASFNPFEKYQLDFIDKIGESVASTISTVKTSEQTAQLLEESRQQSEELAAQEEELRQNIEELQATQEEMRRKEQELMKLSEELEHKRSLIE